MVARQTEEVGKMTEQELRDAEKAQIEYKTVWIEAEYIVAGWWDYDRTKQGRTGISGGNSQSSS